MDFNFSPLFISLRVAGVATFVTFFIGLYAAHKISDFKKGRAFFDSIFTLPLILPPTVLGFFLLLIFGRNSTIGAFLQSIGVNIVFSWIGAVVASSVVAFPLMYRTSLGAFEQIDENVINSAKTLGLSKLKIFWFIKVPMAKSGILAGTILAFARALGEFGATIMVAGNIPDRTQTMAVAVFSAVMAGNRELAYIWVMIILTVSVILITLMNYFAKKRWNSDPC